MDNHYPCEALTKGPFERSLYRSLDGEEPRVQNKSIERYFYPALRLSMSDGVLIAFTLAIFPNLSTLVFVSRQQSKHVHATPLVLGLYKHWTDNQGSK
jgi:hypothetical protein